MKIGLLGGSFNPIHNGHLTIAEFVLNSQNINEIWFLPTGKHPFKENHNLISFEQRFSLVQKAISDNHYFKVKNFDNSDGRINYTDDLIKKIRRKYPLDEFYFIIGEDNVEELQFWHNYRWLLDNINFIVLSRNSKLKSDWKSLDYIKKFKFVKMIPINISSTQIRSKIFAGESIKSLVPNFLENEIIELYLKMMKPQIYTKKKFNI
ncbi:MAG: nicotinate (nicotinamide) nucleotide adenylyltransferase [Candidatus Cloacimonetes bacterium]|nr:nicotinate (nicotinamide) nucleotide adenylyltransferase [Candidatus Cloacimonadota bacterium]